MNTIKKYLFIFLTLAMSSVVTGQSMDYKSEDCVAGKIRMKLKPEQLKSSGQFKSLSGDIEGSDIGISSIDNVSRSVGIKRIRRVFPFSEKHEALHRQYGLHLWIEMDFDQSINPLNVVEQYKHLSDLEVVKPILKKVSLDGDKNVVPYKVDVLSTGGAKVNSSASSSAAYEPFFNDPLLSAQWHYENDGNVGQDSISTHLFEAWKQSSGSSQVIVAVVDQGIDVFHEDLYDNIWKNEAELNGEEGVDDDGNGYIDDFYGFNFTSSEEHIQDGAITPGSHGTHVAGTVGAVSNNGIGVAGVAGGNGSGNGVKMISCQVFDSRVNGGRNFAEAIIYGADNGAIISQNSWGYNRENYYEPEVYDAIKYFIETAGRPRFPDSPMEGGVLFFAAGNDGIEKVVYPGAFDNVIGVTSVSADGLPAPYTTYGEWTDIAALGGDMTNFGEEGGVMSTLPNNEYGYIEGTSMACPHVSGVAALAIAKFGNEVFTADDLKRIILNSSDRFIFQHNNKYGKGLLNAASALEDPSRTPPEPIKDLRAADTFHNEIRLEWTVPVDTDNGEPRYFYFAISESEITDANFENNGLFLLENELKAGETFSIAIGGLTKLTNYWFAVKSADRFENISDISNILKTQTSNLPHFMESTRLVEVDIDVTMDAIVKIPIGLSNIGDGIIYYDTKITNEEYFLEPEEEEAQQALMAEIAKKAEDAKDNTELFENTQAVLKPIAALKGAGTVPSETEHWGYDRTEFLTGIGYHDETVPPSDLLGSGNVNTGLIAAIRFDIPYDYSFNLTHIQTVLLPEINNKPIIIEIKKGSKYVEEAKTVYVQEYYPDTVDVLKYYNIPLYRPQLFEDKDIFWIVMHYPKEMQYPMVVQTGSMDYAYFLLSKNNGNSFFDAAIQLNKRIRPMLYALTTGKDGSYVFLDPASGEIHKGDTKTANVIIDATNLTEGKHLASLGIVTNDINKPIVNIEVKVDVNGQLPVVETDAPYDFRAYVAEENELFLDVENVGLADLEIYDIQSTTNGIAKGFNDTVVIRPDYEARFPFKFTPDATGIVQTKLSLVTNIGNVDLPCEFQVVEAPQMNIVANTIVDVNYGETATVNLELQNTGNTTALEYDLSHYNSINLAKGKLPFKMNYQILTSADVGGPSDNQWDDISSFAGSYDYLTITGVEFELGMKFPFFNEQVVSAFANQRGQFYFYSDGLLGNNPDADLYGTSKGLMVPLWINEHFQRITDVKFYSYGDRVVYSIIANVVDNYETGFKPITEVSYQIVLFKDGAIEFRYKDVSGLLPEWTYAIAVQGLIRDDLLLYSSFDDTNDLLYNGKVVRFEPTTAASMVASANPYTGIINAGESANVNVTLNPEAYSFTEGTYVNSVLVKTNTPAKEETINLTINVNGTSDYSVVDTIDFGTINLGTESEELVRLYNNGSANGSATNITFEDAQFTIQASLPVSLNAAANYPLLVNFKPTATGIVESKMHVTFDNGTTGIVVLKARCVEDPEYTINIPSNIVVDINGGESTSIPVSIQNLDKGVDLSYTFKNNWLSRILPNVENVEGFVNPLNTEFGYWWNVSDDTRPFYKWEDISAEAEKLIIRQDSQKMVVLPFEFPFFGERYDTIWISKNGYVTVIEPESDNFVLEFEKEDGLRGMIAPFWSDLKDAGDLNGIKLKVEDQRVLVQWDNFTPLTGDPGTASFQLEINADGAIYFHYKDISSWGYILNYGLESPDESEVVETDHSWIVQYAVFTDKSSLAFIPPQRNKLVSGQSEDLLLELSAEHIYHSGIYKDTILLHSNSKAQALYTIPVQLNVTGAPILDAPSELNWDNVIYKSDLTISRIVTLTNVGYETLTIKQISDEGLEKLVLYNEQGDRLVKTSSGVLLNPIVIEPWEQVSIKVEIPVSEHIDVNGKIEYIGDFTTLSSLVKADIVDSPVFNWTAEDQNFSLNNTGVQEFTFSVTNNGETALDYKLTPAAIPSGGNGELPVIVEGEGNYTLEPPVIVNSLALDAKESPDGSFVPWSGGADLAFANQYVAPQGGFFLTHIQAYSYFEAIGEFVKVMVYMGGDEPQAGEKLFEQIFVIDKKVDDEWTYFPLEQPVAIPEGQVFYVIVAVPQSWKYLGFDNSSDISLLERSFSGVYRENSNYYWYKQYEQSQPVLWKIRALTAAGNDQWIQLDTYGGELSAGESIEVTATINAAKAGQGEHRAKLIAGSNDINNPGQEVDVYLTVNGGPEFRYYPNIYKDTLRMKETEELLLNYLVVDPEGDKMDISMEDATGELDVKLKRTTETTAQVHIKSDYDSEGVHTYPVHVIDEAGSVANDTIVIKVMDKNRAPVLNPEFSTLTLNLADPSGITIHPSELFTDPDGDELQIYTGNYHPELVDMALGSAYIHLSPLSEGTAVVLFAADDGKEDGFVIYSVYVQVIDDPDLVNASPSGNTKLSERMLDDNQSLMVYPNPVTEGNCSLIYKVEQESDVIIEIYSSTGQKIEMLETEVKDKGEYSKLLNLDGYNSGIYLCRLVINGKVVASEKIIVRK